MHTKIFITTFIFLAVLFAAPVFADAHTDMPVAGTVDDDVVSQEEFEDVQDVMIKMMNGEELTESEWTEMNEFMESHHGSFGGQGFVMPMHSGMMGYGGYGMMGGAGGGTFMYWMSLLTMVVWLLVGLLLSAVLIKKLNRTN